MTYLDSGGPDGVAAWLQHWEETVGTLLPINRGKMLQFRRMTDQALLYILQKRAREAVVKGFCPHDLRRAFISDLLDAGDDIAKVQKLAGHANVTTTPQ